VLLLAAALLFTASTAQAQGLLERMRERAASRTESETENRANRRVDETVDKGLDCVFNPIECARSKKESAPAPSEAPAATPPPVNAAADATEWYAEQKGEHVGPMAREELGAMITRGDVSAETLVWHEGLKAWTPAGRVSELSAAFKKGPPPLPPKRSGPPPLPAQR